MASIIVAFAAVQSRHLFPSQIVVGGDHAVVPALATRLSHFILARGDDSDDDDDNDEDHDDEKHHTHHTSDTTTSMNTETGSSPCGGIPNLSLPPGVTCPVSTIELSDFSIDTSSYSATGSATVPNNDTRTVLPSTTAEAASASSASAAPFPIPPIRLSSFASPMPTLPPTSPSSSAPLSSSTGSPARESSPAANSSSIRVANHGGAIAGGVIGGIVFILLLVLAILLFLRRRRRKRTPASAEFRDLNAWQQQQRGMSIASRGPLAAQSSMEHLEGAGADVYGDAYDAPPPPFHPGTFSDPLFEKIQETRQAHINYGFSSQ